MNTSLKAVSDGILLELNGERLEPAAQERGLTSITTFAVEGVTTQKIGERAFFACASLAGIILPEAFALDEKTGCLRPTTSFPPPVVLPTTCETKARSVSVDPRQVHQGAVCQLLRMG